MEAKDQNPKGINWIYYAEIYDNYSGILWHGTEIQYGHPINNFLVHGDREITIYLSMQGMIRYLESMWLIDLLHNKNFMYLENGKIRFNI